MKAHPYFKFSLNVRVTRRVYKIEYGEVHSSPFEVLICVGSRPDSRGFSLLVNRAEKHSGHCNLTTPPAGVSGGEVCGDRGERECSQLTNKTKVVIQAAQYDAVSVVKYVNHICKIVYFNYLFPRFCLIFLTLK